MGRLYESENFATLLCGIFVGAVLGITSQCDDALSLLQHLDVFPTPVFQTLLFHPRLISWIRIIGETALLAYHVSRNVEQTIEKLAVRGVFGHGITVPMNSERENWLRRKTLSHFFDEAPRRMAGAAVDHVLSPENDRSCRNVHEVNFIARSVERVHREDAVVQAELDEPLVLVRRVGLRHKFLLCCVPVFVFSSDVNEIGVAILISLALCDTNQDAHSTREAVKGAARGSTSYFAFVE